MFIDTHPTETAGSGKPLRDIKHRASNESSETLKIPCPHCGFINTLNRDNPTNTQGEGHKAVSTIQQGGSSAFEPVRVSGCCLCGHDFTTNTYSIPLENGINLSGR